MSGTDALTVVTVTRIAMAVENFIVTKLVWKDKGVTMGEEDERNRAYLQLNFSLAWHKGYPKIKFQTGWVDGEVFCCFRRKP